MDGRVRNAARPLFTRLLLACVMFSSAVGNHTGRIKVVFTPTICKLTCMGGRCHNNCKQGNTTTIISENGRATDTLTAPNFRVGKSLPCSLALSLPRSFAPSLLRSPPPNPSRSSKLQRHKEGHVFKHALVPLQSLCLLSRQNSQQPLIFLSSSAIHRSTSA